jgi:hypothetical protein
MYMLPENRIESLFSEIITESWNIHIRVICNAKATAQVTNYIPRRMIIYAKRRDVTVTYIVTVCRVYVRNVRD